VPTRHFTFKERFGWGAAGAFVHEAYRLEKVYGAINLPPFPRSYYLLTVALIIGGGLFSAAWKDDKEWKCFYLGVSVGVYIAVWSAVHS
jgi:hypothetical protein